MILIWLGSWALMLFGFEMSQAELSSFLKSKTKNAFLKILTSVSPQRSLYAGAVGMSAGRLSMKEGLTLMSFDFLGAWWVFLLSGLFLNIQGLIFVGLGWLIFANVYRIPKIRYILKFSFATGVFLVGGESLLRQSAMLQSMLGESGIAFWLVDGRLPAVLSIVLLGLVLGLFIRLQFWSLILALCLLISSTISFSGALALFAGELLAHCCLLAYRSRQFSAGLRNLVRKWSVASGAGVLVGLFGTWYLKELLNWGSSFGMNGSEERSSQFLILAAVLILMQGFFQMVAGHFLSRSVPKGDPASMPIPSWWFESGILTREDWF